MMMRNQKKARYEQTTSRHTSFLSLRLLSSFLALAFLAPTTFLIFSLPHSADASHTADTNEMEPVFSYGFDAISKRTLDPSTARSLALEGIKGLVSLDPAISFHTEGNSLILSTPTTAPLYFAAPPPQDPDGWSKTTIQIVSSAQKASSILRSMTTEETYQIIFDSILSQIDHFSHYAGRLKAEENRAKRYGFGGIGIRYRLEKSRISIFEVTPNSPAETIGLHPGDSIVLINGHDIASLSHTVSISYEPFLFSADNILTLTIEHEGVLRTISIHRDLLVSPSVTLASIDDGIAKLTIEHFTQDTAHAVIQAFQSALESTPVLRGIILDLRGNPGGLLDQAVDIADLFMTHGRIVSTARRNPEAIQHYAARPNDITNGLPLVVLVDGHSASATEILAAALQDSGRAVIVGSTSYGKGTVQTVLRLPNDGEITLTWSRFLSPSGYALHELGVMPVICPPESTADISETLKAVQEDSGLIPRWFFLWRTTPLNDQEGRRILRNICPPKSHIGWTIDEDIARRLLKDPTLYAQALSLSSVQSVSQQTLSGL